MVYERTYRGVECKQSASRIGRELIKALSILQLQRFISSSDYPDPYRYSLVCNNQQYWIWWCIHIAILVLVGNSVRMPAMNVCVSCSNLLPLYDPLYASLPLCPHCSVPVTRHRALLHLLHQATQLASTSASTLQLRTRHRRTHIWLLVIVRDRRNGRCVSGWWLGARVCEILRLDLRATCIDNGLVLCVDRRVLGCESTVDGAVECATESFSCTLVILSVLYTRA